MNNIQEAIQFLKDISWKIGTTGVEYLSEKDGEKMRNYINILEKRIDEVEK